MLLLVAFRHWSVRYRIPYETQCICACVWRMEEEEKASDCELVGLFVAQCFSLSGGGRAVTVKADGLERSVARSHPAQDYRASPVSHHTVLTVKPWSVGWNPSVYPAKNRFHTLWWRGFSWQDPPSPPPPPLPSRPECRYWYAMLSPGACQLSSNRVWRVLREAGKRNLACPREEETARRKKTENIEFQGGGWMDGQDREWRGREVGRRSVRRNNWGRGAAINTMTHSFCGGHFLTAFIKANLIILAR